MMQLSVPRRGAAHGRGAGVFAAALVGWVVAFLGDRAVEGITRVVRGSPEYRALQEALTVAIGALLADVPADSREALENALRERFSTPASVVKDGRTRVRTGIIRAIQVQLAPLADPAITPTGKSFFDEIGVDGAQLRDEVADIVIRSIEQVGPGHPALMPLLTQLNADALAEQVDAVLDGIASLHALADAPARPDPRNGGWRVSKESRARQLEAMERSADIAERLTRALLDVPAVADPESRSMVISLLPNRLREAIPYSRFPRIHVLGMVTASENQENGLRSLIRAVRIAEGDTDAMGRLDMLIIDLESDTDEPGEQQ